MAIERERFYGEGANTSRTEIGKDLWLGLPDFGQSFKIIVEPGFSHEFDHAEFNGAQKNQIQKYLGVAILNWKFGFSHIFS